VMSDYIETKKIKYPKPKTVRESMDLVFEIMAGWIEDAYDDTADVDEALDILSTFIEDNLKREEAKEGS
jgi:hypothetical protein